MTLNDVVVPIEILTFSTDEGTVNGQPVTKGSYPTIHDACIALTVPLARQAGAPLLTHAVDTIGTPLEYWLHVHPDGQATPAVPVGAPLQMIDDDPHGVAETQTFPKITDAGPTVGPIPGPRGQYPEPAPSMTRAERRHAAEQSARSSAAPPLDLPASPVAAPVPSPTLDDLLASRPAPPDGPAQLGWRATVRRLSGGLIALRPSEFEVTQRRGIAAVQRSLAGPKTVVVINPKGGASKTTATLLLAATFGIHRGGYTLAWDNNETRGTMGWRATQGRHTNTAVDLLRELDRFEDARSARVGDLDNFVRSQGSAQFDVLASD